MENQQPQNLFVSVDIEKDGKINIRSNIPDQVKVLGLLSIASSSVSQSMINGIPPKKIGADGQEEIISDEPKMELVPDPEKNDPDNDPTLDTQN